MLELAAYLTWWRAPVIPSNGELRVDRFWQLAAFVFLGELAWFLYEAGAIRPLG